ncbi:MAG: VCBS repeat-containing protein, partial [Gemmatimonadetes bacterium]|nr:VCBS repeat-containing protein [Gemmatimonadota bacterium]
MRLWRLPLLRVLAALAPVGCGTNAGEPWHEEGGGAYRWKQLHVRGRLEGGFTRLSERRTGLDFRNQLSQEKALENRFLAHGSGVALGDVDGDGLLDVYLPRLEGANTLYRNLGNWRFAEVAIESGVAAPDRYSTGAAFADVEGDGDLDLILTALGGPNALFLNDGTGHFTEQGSDAGLDSRRGSTTIAMADVNGDGFLDLYIANYKVATVRDLIPPQARAFDQVIRRRGETFEVAAEFREHYREAVDALGRLIRTERADPDWFYLNDGKGRFRTAPLTSGRFLDENGRPYTEEPDYFGLVARLYDVSGDQHPDLYVANDFSGPDQFWINDGSGRFRAAPPLALRSTSHSSMAVDFSDIDRDGHTDFFVVDMLAPAESARRRTQTPTNTPLPKLVGEIENRPQMQRNSLYLNRGDGTFAQIADLAGVEASEWSWATLFLDVDLDGYEDILITTGHLWDVMDSDTHERLATTFPSVEWRRGLLEFPPLAVRNFAFRNRGDFTFEDMSERWGFGREADVSHGMAVGDLDGDGDLDVVVNRLGSPVAVYRNDAGASRVAVRLAGRPPNTQGVGAKIRVRDGPVPVQ